MAEVSDSDQENGCPVVPRMKFLIVYWKVLFWANVVLAVVHASIGHSFVFLAIGMAVFSKLMIWLLENSTETPNE